MARTVAVIVALLGGAAHAAPADDAAPTCAQRLAAQREASLALDYQAFDQTEGQGFRTLAGDCPGEAADLIEAWIAKHDAKETSPVWHIAQLRAENGETDAALDAARRSLRPGGDTTALRWNDYVSATIAFLEKDRAAFDRHRDVVAAGGDAHAGNAMNLKFLDRLGANFDKNYRDAQR